ncbi:family 1 encapsulin nanocompartment shell protein [Caldivirga sp.]|uniref:family 1 encapsulin nanocompartment shell protein n=1 Tax=Caldivirga sp. TaxID=2080243 RepID=UPI003D0E38F6
MVFSKNPVDIVRDRKFNPGEVADALRLAIMAELDAINLYLQLSRLTDDEKVRSVLEDVAKEEKAHFGEFLTLLKSLDPEQAEQVKAGAKEVEERTGIKVVDSDPPQQDVVRSSNLSEDELRYIEGKVKETADGARRLRKHIPLYPVGAGYDSVTLEEAIIDKVISSSRVILPLKELSIMFTVPQRQVEYARMRGERIYSVAADQAAIRLANQEDAAILGDLLNHPKVRKLSITSWDTAGSAVNEVSRAVNMLMADSIPEPYVLFVSPGRYTKLLSVVERTGVMELSRVKSLVKDVVIIPQLTDDTALLMSVNSSTIDLAIGADTAIIYLGPEDDAYAFRLWETLAVRVKDSRGLLILKQSP